MENRGLGSTRRWLARLSFSFFIIAFWLAWVAYKGWTNGTLAEWRVVLAFIAAAMSFSLGLMGVRERHRDDSRDS